MKKLKKILFLLLTIGILYAGFIFSLIISGTHDKPFSDPDSIVILGAKVKGTPAQPSAVLKERLDTALIFLQQNKNVKVVVCGGKGADESDSEANVMAKYLIENGIDEKQIVREDTSTRTKENLTNAKNTTTLGKTVIISNDFHMYRAKLLARRIGIKSVCSLPATSKTSAKYVTYAREVMALGYALLFDW